MLVAYLESVKYIGHLFPLALLRVYLGYFYLKIGIDQYHGLYVRHPNFEDTLNQILQMKVAPEWFLTFVQSSMMGSWEVWAHIFIGLQIAVGVSYVLGFAVRPLSLIAALLGLFSMCYMSGVEVIFTKTLFILHLTLGWLGAGRCLGFDYYFYKRQRGLWW